jgi:lysophospholipase L1-like esterase
VNSTRLCSWVLVGLVAASIGCISSSGGSPGQSGGTARGGVSASGGKNGSGGARSSGGQNSGGNAGAGVGGTGGSSGGSGSGGTTGPGGSSNGSGGQGTGGAAGNSAMGGKAAGGSAGSTGAQTGGGFGAGGVATGGALTTGGQGSGGKNTGGATGAGGAASGGNGTGGSATGGTSGSGGSATGGASGTGGKTGTYHPCPTDGTLCKIMPFGDSITDGYNSDTPGGYRVELFHRALADGKKITFVGSGSNGPSTVDGAAFPPSHEGHSGWTIAPAGGRSGISTLVASVMPKYMPDIVLLMIGTNDAIDNYDMANAPTRLKALIDSIYVQLPNVLIVVAQPIPSRGDASKGDDTALSDRIKAFNATIPAVVKAQADAGKHILIVDMFTPFNPTKASLIEDQWHPNLAGYVVLGDQWYSVLKSLL